MKDAKGHGSNARGGSYHNIDKNARGAGKHVGHAGEPFHIQKSNGPKSNWYSAVGQRSGTVMSGKGLGAISSKLADHAAAAELARGNPKADAAPIHSGALGWKDHVAAGRSNFFGSDGKPLRKPGSIL